MLVEGCGGDRREVGIWGGSRAEYRPAGSHWGTGVGPPNPQGEVADALHGLQGGRHILPP